jgi:Family of unknown function (DUF6186)
MVPGGPVRSHYATILGYLTVLAGGVGLQVLAVRIPERLPTLGRVFTHVMRTRTGRVGVLVAWGWIGLHFFAK